MAILVIDPQGEFAKDMRGQRSGEFALPLDDILKNLGKQTVVFSVNKLVLDTWELFKEILYESPFFERLSIPKGDNRAIACDILAEKLQKKKIKLKQLYTKDSFFKAWEILSDDKVQNVIYKSSDARNR